MIVVTVYVEKQNYSRDEDIEHTTGVRWTIDEDRLTVVDDTNTPIAVYAKNVWKAVRKDVAKVTN